MASTILSMPGNKHAVRIVYSKPGTQPPIFVAGSFCEWQPQEMQFTTDAQGEHKFIKVVEVEEGQTYQYKFRIGEGDWWTLNEDEPTGMYSLMARPSTSQSFLDRDHTTSALVSSSALPTGPHGCANGV